MRVDHTTIRIADDTWQALDDRKDRGESFDDVVRELLDATSDQEVTVDA